MKRGRTPGAIPNEKGTVHVLTATPRSKATELAHVMASAVGCESIQEIMNSAVTAEALGVTLLGVALQNAGAGALALSDDLQKMVKAARAEEQAHYAFLTRSGAQPTTNTFTLPDPRIVTDVPTFLNTLIALEETSSAFYLAAAQEFAILGNSSLAELSLAITAVEAAHRVAFRAYAVDAGVVTGPPNDIAFSKGLYASVSEAIAALRQLGFIGGSGTPLTYPGPGAIDYTGVKDLTP
jgi:hypothetical protein